MRVETRAKYVKETYDVYIAMDGAVFNDEKTCMEYENTRMEHWNIIQANINAMEIKCLENIIPLPDRKTLTGFVKLISAVSAKLELEKSLLETLQTQKRYLLTQMFV